MSKVNNMNYQYSLEIDNKLCPLDDLCCIQIRKHYLAFTNPAFDDKLYFEEDKN